MINFSQVCFSYGDPDEALFEELNLHIPENSLTLVVGPTGSGKSTLLGLTNGLVPHFTGGHLSGSITIDDTAVHASRPRDLAGTVGAVQQDPYASFVADTVETEIAYGLEQLAVPGQTMRKRVEEVIDILGLQEVRNRKVSSLSGGEAQRTAIGAVLVTHPRLLVLDEPTSALDPTSAEEVLAVLKRLVDDVGMTILMAEHRLERVSESADMVVSLQQKGGEVLAGDPCEILALSPIRPPLTRLGLALGWSPLPMTIRAAKRAARDSSPPYVEELHRGKRPVDEPHVVEPSGAAQTNWAATSAVAASVERLDIAFDGHKALKDVTFHLERGQTTTLMGRNGAGKTTLLKCMAGLLKPEGGIVTIDSAQLEDIRGFERIARVGLVPAQPTDLLIYESVGAECLASDKDAQLSVGTTRRLLRTLAPDVSDDDHPRDLSEGQKLCVVLAIVCAANPRVLLLDEPTRGLDYQSKLHLDQVLCHLKSLGTAVLIATHDVEFAAQIADKVIVLAEGEVIANGRALEILTASPMFAPQVSKIFPDRNWLTVDQALLELKVPA